MNSKLIYKSVFFYIISLYLSLYLSIYRYTVLVGFGQFFSFLIYTHSVGLLGQVTSQSHGRYLRTEQHKHRIDADRHPYLKWDSNSRSQCWSSRKRHALDHEDSVISVLLTNELINITNQFAV
jgi:hypothetical protein